MSLTIDDWRQRKAAAIRAINFVRGRINATPLHETVNGMAKGDEWAINQLVKARQTAQDHIERIERWQDRWARTRGLTKSKD